MTASGRRRGERLGLHQAGNAINSATVQVGSVAGPVLGGLLVATAGPAPAFAVDAASFSASALSLALIRPSRPAARAAQGVAAAETGTADTEAADTVPAPTATGPAGATEPAVGSTGMWALLRLPGRVMSVVMLAALGSFPLLVAVSGVLVRNLDPAPFFPVASAVVAVAILGALSQAEFRDFGTADPSEAKMTIEPA